MPVPHFPLGSFPTATKTSQNFCHKLGHLFRNKLWPFFTKIFFVIVDKILSFLLFFFCPAALWAYFFLLFHWEMHGRRRLLRLSLFLVPPFPSAFFLLLVCCRRLAWSAVFPYREKFSTIYSHAENLLTLSERHQIDSFHYYLYVY